MARVSQVFSLNRTQPALDFVDVDTSTDLAVFVDPRALRLLNTEWGSHCVSLIQGFFTTVLEAIRHDDDKLGKELLLNLSEPNETHLGLSTAKSRGRAIGSTSAADLWSALKSSEAAQSGLLEDLEDTALLVEGISSDIISDITTNIIRQPLVHYTQTACRWYGIPLVPDIDSGPMWNPTENRWFNQFEEFPVVNNEKLLLVPKSIVRQRLDYDSGEYYRNFILAHLQDRELSLPNSSLVFLLKNGERRVYKKDLKEKYGEGKYVAIRETKTAPSLLSRYRQSKSTRFLPPLDHETLSEVERTPLPDWDGLLDAVIKLKRGKKDADDYEKAIEGLLSAIFYPWLSNPVMQHRIHDGRKRIDISYTNIAQDGFFAWLGAHYPSQHIFCECKNYKEDPANPEIDQLAGRFSPNRGRIGFLVCRNITNKDLLIQRCRDTSDDDRGFIIPLDDEDLINLVADRKKAANTSDFALLKERFESLVM